jgi:hypothetical protein
MGLFDVFKKGKVSGRIVPGGAPRSKPGTVFVNPGSKVYHCDWGGCSGVSADAVQMSEKKAIAAGLSRCRRCDWYEFDREAHRG